MIAPERIVSGPAKILAYLRMIFGNDWPGIIELRALGRITFNGYYDLDHLQQMAADAWKLTKTRGIEGVYFSLNPVNSLLLARRVNRVDRCGRNDGATDADIVARRWLLIDVDPQRPAGISSTGEELSKAEAKAKQVYLFLKSAGWPDPLRAVSGNGWHLLYRIDLPANDGGLIQRALKALDAKFSGDGVSIDTKVGNQSRICKLYGTYSRKGDSTADRPHRLAAIVGGDDQSAEVVRPELLEHVAATAPRNGTHRPRQAVGSYPSGPGGPSAFERAERYAASVEPAIQGNNGSGVTYRLACELVRGFDLTASQALHILAKYSERCEPPWSEAELLHKISEARQKADGEPGYLLKREAEHDGVTREQAASVEFMAFDDGAESAAPATPAAPSPSGQTINESADDPHGLAVSFLEDHHPEIDGVRTIGYSRGEWLLWSGGAWRAVPLDEIRAVIVNHIKRTFDRENAEAVRNVLPGKNPPPVTKVTKAVVANTLQALESLCLIPSHHEPPCWIVRRTGPRPQDLFSTRRNLLNLSKLASGDIETIAATPTYFNWGAADYDYDPSAACPAWEAFLNAVWPDDPEAVATLQEFFGYLLGPDTSLQKILFIIGPPRSGKGTISYVLKLLLGVKYVATPTLGSLSGPFGLWPLLGKLLAIITDARLSGRDDSVSIVERLLSISGEDGQDVHRKNLPTLTGCWLPVRFVLFSNELPNLRDASGALMSRIVLLRMVRSFLGKEDRTLKDRIGAELPGILNWAIAGLRRLRSRGEFQQPKSAVELLNDLDSLSSPIKAFIRQRCLVGLEFQATPETLYESWTSWCKEQGRDHVGPKESFCKDLRAAMPQLKDYRPRIGGNRSRYYRGIDLRPPGYETPEERNASSDENTFEPFDEIGPGWSAGQSFAHATPSNGHSEGVNTHVRGAEGRYADHPGPARNLSESEIEEIGNI